MDEENKGVSVAFENPDEGYALCPVCSEIVYPVDKKCTNCGTELDWGY